MIEVGESTGALPQMLNSVAEFFEEDVQTNLTAAMSLIEPVILIVMGLVVTRILIALYLPIFSLSAGGAAGGQQELGRRHLGVWSWMRGRTGNRSMRRWIRGRWAGAVVMWR